MSRRSRFLSRSLSRPLWLLAAGSLATAGCANDKAESSRAELQYAMAPGELSAAARRGADEAAGAPAPDGPPRASTGSARLRASKDEHARRALARDIAKARVSGVMAYDSSGSAEQSRQAPASLAVAGALHGHASRRSQLAAPPPVNTEDYRDHGVNTMTSALEDRMSTFAIDVDTASYAIARRHLTRGTLPPPASVRVEEFVNYFHYDYPGPDDGRPFAVHLDAAPSPFTPGRHLLRVGVQARRLSKSERKPAHLVFLVDVSGSMQAPGKLGLAKRALRILVDNLGDGDTVALVTYAGATRVVLEPTGLAHRARIVEAIEDLRAGGSTNMGSGIQLAYDMAARNLGPGSVSRVIVLSDGDANVGRTSHQDILATIRGKVKEGVTLSTIGFGMGNYKDTLMEQLANQGNGNYYYIDDRLQARRVFQEQLAGTLEVVAKDVKIQVEMDPDAVSHYRLIGYENRDIADEDFRDDAVDAGEIGAGHTVTALYEVVLTGAGDTMATVHVRAKQPRGSRATESAFAIRRDQVRASFARASADFRFATAVMATAEVLRRSPYAAAWSLEAIREIAAGAGEHPRANVAAERRELVDMLDVIRAPQHLLTLR